MKTKFINQTKGLFYLGLVLCSGCSSGEEDDFNLSQNQKMNITVETTMLGGLVEFGESSFITAGSLSNSTKEGYISESMLTGFSQLKFKEKKGNGNAVFSGEILSPKGEDKTIYLFYESVTPKIKYNKAGNSFLFDFDSQVQTGALSSTHLSDYNIMSSKSMLDDKSGHLNVDFKKYASIIKINVNNMDNEEISSAVLKSKDGEELFVASGKINVDDLSMSDITYSSSLSLSLKNDKGGVKPENGKLELYYTVYDCEKLLGKDFLLSLSAGIYNYDGDINFSGLSSDKINEYSVEVQKKEMAYKYISMDIDDMLSTKAAYLEGDPQAVSTVGAIISNADKKVEDGKVFTIVNKPYFPPGVGANDYVSVSPYKWPNPNTPDGYPYISKDGEVNPESRTKYTDKQKVDNVSDYVKKLGLAYFYTGDVKYPKRVEEIIKVFFLDPATKMNPHLNFGQSTPTPNTPSGSVNGFIETTAFVGMLEGFNLAAENGVISTEVVDGMYDWMTEYLNWCDTSDLGVRLRENGTQNHVTHFDRQTTAYRLFLGLRDETYLKRAKEYLQKYSPRRLREQVKSDGSQPEELRRTKSWNYTNMNMQGFFQTALMAERVGFDLWNYEENGQVYIKSMIDWFLPYLAKEKAWTWKQIQKEPVTKIQYCLEMAAKKYDDDIYLKAIDNFQTIHENIVYEK